MHEYKQTRSHKFTENIPLPEIKKNFVTIQKFGNFWNSEVFLRS